MRFAVMMFKSVLITLVVLGLAGCSLPPALVHTFSHYRSPSVMAVRRAVFLPLENHTPFPPAADQLQQALAGQIRSAGLFEVVVVPQVSMDQQVQPYLTPAGFNESFIADVARRHRVDAVILGTLTDYQPYWPPKIGAQIHVISADESVAIASVDGQWDARDETIALQANDYYVQQTAQHELPHADLALHAPSYFNAFVANQIVGGLAVKLQPPPDTKSNGSGWSILRVLHRQR